MRNFISRGLILVISFLFLQGVAWGGWFGSFGSFGDLGDRRFLEPAPSQPSNQVVIANVDYYGEGVTHGWEVLQTQVEELLKYGVKVEAFIVAGDNVQPIGSWGEGEQLVKILCFHVPRDEEVFEETGMIQFRGEVIMAVMARAGEVADIVNLSFGYASPELLPTTGFKQFIFDRFIDTLWVASGPNPESLKQGKLYHYPAAHTLDSENVLAVGSHLIANNPYYIDVIAAAVSAVVQQGVSPGTGTSFSAARATAIAALVKLQNPGLTPSDVKALLTSPALTATAAAEGVDPRTLTPTRVQKTVSYASGWTPVPIFSLEPFFGGSFFGGFIW